MDPHHFIDASRRLATAQRGKPRQVDLRRALSTSYYGMLHTVSNAYADILIGTSTVRDHDAWLQAYRSIGHSQLARCCNRKDIISKFSTEMQYFCNTLGYMHSTRNEADYNPKATFFRSEVLDDIESAKNAINNFMKSELHERKALLVYATTSSRKS